MKRLRWLAPVLCLALVAPSVPQTRVLSASVAHADEGASIGEQIASDLITAGVSLGAALTGNVPLALAAGFLSKYISTYGVQGVKALIDYFKGYSPQDLGEINLYYVYLLHVKRNLFQAMINIRKSVQADDSLGNLEKELARVEQILAGECQAGCKPEALDDSLVNHQFLNLILDAKQSVDVSKYLSIGEVKNTYQYLLLLYMDVIIVEQKLIESQYNMLANRTLQTLEILKKNRFISQAEKEYQGQLLMNMALRWQLLSDQRRVVIAEAIRNPMAALKSENDRLKDEIDEYKDRQKKKKGGRRAQVD